MEVSSWPSDEFHQLYGNANVAQYQPKSELKFQKYRIGLFVAYIILLSVGAAGNCWVITVIGRLLRQAHTEAPRSVQIYIFALCCCDLVALLFFSLVLFDLAYGHWIIPISWLCKVYMASESTNKFGAPFLLTSLTSFCYVTICRGQLQQSAPVSIRPRSIRSNISKRFEVAPSSPKFALAMVFVCAVLVVVLATPVYKYSDIYYVVLKNGSVIHRVVPKCILQPPERILTCFTVYSFALGYLVPAILLTYFYSSVLYFVRKNAKLMRAERSQRFWRVAKTSMGLVGFYLACWTPYWIMSLYYYFKPHTTTGAGGLSHAGLVLSYFVHMLPYINCSGYPILYTLLNRRIRDDYSKAKAISRDRRRRQAAARGSIFSNVSSGTGSHPFIHPLASAFAWVWAFGNRQRYHVYAARRAQFYSTADTNSFDFSTNQAEDSANKQRSCTI